MKTQSEIDGTPYPANCSTIIQQFDAVVKQYPHNLAVICTHQPRNLYELGRSEKKPCLEWTYDTLNHAVGSFVSSIASHGLPPGTPFFLLCQNRIEYLVATLAAYHLGYKHVPLNPEHLSNPNDIQYAIDLVLRSDTQESAVILASNTVAENIDLLAIPRGTIKIAMDGDCDGWIPFESFLKEVSTNKSIMSPSHESTVLFTSGSTGRPKGCLISADRWFSALSTIMTWGSIEPSDVVAMTLPNQHAFGHICIIMPLLRGACLVYPGPKFEPATAAKGIIQHRCTHVPLVATMLPSLMEMISPSEAMSLKGFVFGAMVLSPDLLQSCVDHFGLAYFENLYGMTEGVFASTGPITSMDLIKSDIGLSIGSPVSGCIMRVCGVDDRVPVPRGTVGQLHVSGYTTVKSYIGRNTTDFYVKDGRQWFITGDAAILHEDDQLYLVGRYKDMIIRGGENITPSRIEALLHGVPSLGKLLPQIVGQQDPIAGEVPVAVVKEEISSCEVKLLKDTVREALGPIHTPTQVIPLQKLGIEDYPKSQANKIIKPELQRLVKVYRRSESSQDDSSSALQVKVTTAWARSLGLDPQEIDIQSKLSDFADSILMLTARDAVRKSTGQSAPLEAWLKAETIAHQIALLRKSTGNRSHRTADASKTSMAAPSLPTSKPPSVEDMVHLGDNQEAFSATKLAVQETITPFGLFWHDVTDVYPCPDFIQEVCKSKVIDTWNIRTTVVSNTSVENMRRGLEAMLANNPILLSFIVINPDLIGSNLGLYASVRQTPEILSRCIQVEGSVDTLNEVRAKTMNYPYHDHTRLPGPLFRALILSVRENNSTVAIVNISHAVIDKILHQNLFQDLHVALGGQYLDPHTSHKEWANTYHTLRRSPNAETAISFHASYLRDLKKHCHALWPFATNDLTVTVEREEKDGHALTFPVPSITHLCNTHKNITPPVIAKAALALLVLARTNHSHAFFSNFEAARTRFPFVPDKDDPPDAMDVAGPTFNTVLNLVALHPEETVLGFLNRIQHDQANLTKYASVPWHEVFPRIDCTPDIMSKAVDSLIFNWMPGLGAMGANLEFQNMTITQVHIRTKLGMLASAGMSGDGKNMVMMLQGSLSNMSTMWIERVGEEWKRLCLWLSAEGSWYRPVGEYVEAIW